MNKMIENKNKLRPETTQFIKHHFSEWEKTFYKEPVEDTLVEGILTNCRISLLVFKDTNDSYIKAICNDIIDNQDSFKQLVVDMRNNKDC